MRTRIYFEEAKRFRPNWTAADRAANRAASCNKPEPRPVPDYSAVDKIDLSEHTVQPVNGVVPPTQQLLEEIDHSNNDLPSKQNLKTSPIKVSDAVNIEPSDSMIEQRDVGTSQLHILHSLISIGVFSSAAASCAVAILASLQTAADTDAAITKFAAKRRLQRINPNVIFGQSNGGGLIAE